ncbi:hypothetical protein DES49_1269 [Halospina denitrificans]|uniref:Uncharacterized protein n=1 Tax=Halospina denitrificans TaxID=332522 RepID=A0A4R7JY75_9GAMM|nr:hypothetical protein [Halospina denitrificans]TDT43452.1 hypothetical protein DES49_1269 [Halospina denitrificans]
MQVDAVYDNGSVKLPDHLRFKHQRFTLRIEIPDEEVVSAPSETESQDPEPGSGDIRDQIRAILGPDHEKLTSPPTAEETKEIWHRHLEEKHLGGR